MRVMIILSDQQYSSSFDPFPPVGTIGTAIEGPDEYGEYEVEFDGWPRPTLRDTAWTVHKSMIIFVDDGARSDTTRRAITRAAAEIGRGMA